MLAQITLIPSESKKLIARAVANLDYIKKAATEGIIMMHPSSSTYFIVEAITGKKPPTDYWVCGVVAPKGTCVEMGMQIGAFLPGSAATEPQDFPVWWVIKDGEFCTGIGTEELLTQMKPTDVYIKGVNAIDPRGNVGCLIGAPNQGGPLGRVLSDWRKKSFHLVFPVGLEKMIPVNIKEASKEARLNKYDYSMGLPCALLPLPEGTAITEVDAIRILSDATAVPIGAGGLGGAEGAITLVIKGNDEQVKKAIDYIEQSKGAGLPQLRLSNCLNCQPAPCKFPVGDKHWSQV
ncbi:hypothetical protein ACFLTB_00665 [Chloroflexota bacterium]